MNRYPTRNRAAYRSFHSTLPRILLHEISSPFQVVSPGNVRKPKPQVHHLQEPIFVALRRPIRLGCFGCIGQQTMVSLIATPGAHASTWGQADLRSQLNPYLIVTDFKRIDIQHLLACQQIIPRSDIVLPAVPGTGQALTIQLALGKRAALMGTHAVNGVQLFADTSKNGHDLAFDNEFLTLS